MLKEWLKLFWWIIPIQIALLSFVVWVVMQFIEIGRAAVGI